MDQQVNEASPPRGGRDGGVEAGRFYWAISVIILHSIPIALPGRDTGPAPLWALILATLARTAVPFFFVASGFYLSSEPRRISRALLRLGAIYLACLIGYAIAMQLMPVHRLEWTPVSIITGGVITPLWFLPALAGSIVFVALGERWFGLRVTGAVALLVALAGPILYAYGPLVGLRHYPWRLEPLVRHMAGPLLVWTGLALRGRALPSAGLAWLALGVVELGLFGEQALVSGLRHASHIVEFDMLVLTFVAGVLAFVAAKQMAAPGWLAALGRLSLGIYVVHIGFVWLARSRWPLPDAPDSLRVFAIATALALAVTALYQAIRLRLGSATN